MDASQLAFFTLASLVIIATPGPDMILIMSRSIAMGRTAGISTAAGVSVGLLGHTALAALGVGALLQASELLFMLLKLIGAAYLIHLGFTAFRRPAISFTTATGASDSPRVLFIQGMLSNLSNPKIAIFYFAFLPQFVPSASTHPTLLLLVLGISFSVLTFVIKGPIAIFAARLSRWFRNQPAAQRWLNRICGTVLVSLGLRLIFETREG